MGNVPNLRFPEFSGEWKKFSIEKLCDEFKSGKNIKADNILVDGAYPVYGGNGLRGFTDSYNHDGNYVLIGRQGALCGNVRFVTGKTYITEHAIAVQANKNNNTRFLEYLFVRLNLGQFSDQSAQPGLAVNKLLRIETFVPTVSEQERIVQLLQVIDERITTQNKIIEDLKKLKSAIIDRLYENIDGQPCLYGDSLTVVNEKNKMMEYSNILSASQEFGMIERSDLNIDIKYEKNAITGYKIVREGDYVVHLRSFQGGMAFSQMVGVCSPAYIILRPNDRLSYGYLAPYFTSTSFINSLRLVTYGIRDGRSINVDEWLNMKVRIPSLKVQRHILSIIKSIECKLLNEIKIVNNLLKQRSYLLSQMFI